MASQKGSAGTRWLWLAVILIAFGVMVSGTAAAEAGTSVLKLGVRRDCPPFSYREARYGTYQGYSVDLCLEIARNAQAFMDYQRYEFREVTAQDRFRKLHQGDIDILCEATTVTQERLRRFGPTMYTFVSGASLMYAPGYVQRPEIAIGVLKGTTTENAIQTILDRQTDIGRGPIRNFTRIETETHLTALDDFRRGTIDLYIADREILLALSRRAAEEKLPLIVSPNYYTIEPYALFLRLGDHKLRYIANLTLSEIFKEDIHRIFRTNFPNKRMNDSLRQLFRLQQLLQGVDPLPGLSDPADDTP